MMVPDVLVVDDEKGIRSFISDSLMDEGFEVRLAATGKEALERIGEKRPDLMLLDLKLPGGMDGIKVLQEVRGVDEDIIIIMITGHATTDTAVKATRLGIYDYVSKPIDLLGMKTMIKEAMETQELKREVHQLRAQHKSRNGFDALIGNSPEMKRVCRIIRKVAKSRTTTTLIQGESGTGKELVAKAIHYDSTRRHKSFTEINCTALPENLLESELFGHEKGAFTDAKACKEGLFEVAHRGTLFLDEIGDLSLPMQAKLLRALQERRFKRVGGIKDIEVDIRIIASTNKDLDQAVADKTFREDLYYRLKVVPLYLPPLRERGKDILLLSKYFIDEYNNEFGKNVQRISPEAEELLMNYSWPGNVRELRNVIERAIILESKDIILPEHLLLPKGSFHRQERNINNKLTGKSLAEAEKQLILNVLNETNWNRNKAARILKIDRTTLYKKIKKYELST